MIVSRECFILKIESKTLSEKLVHKLLVEELMKWDG